MESSSDFRGDLEDIVRAGRGRCGVVSESADKQRRYVKESEEDSSNNPSNLSKLTLLDEEYYFNFYCKERDYGFCNSDDVFGDPFSNTRDPLISSTTLDDEQMLHLDNDEICNNTNGFIMPVSGGYNSCRRSSSGLILETLIENSSDDNNINSKKRVIHGSEVQQQQQVDDSNDKMDQCMIINNNNNNHQRDGSRLVQISNIDFNHATAAGGGVTTTAAPAPAGCGFVYDYSLSSTAMVNSCTTTGSKDVDRILNMNPNKVGSVGCMSVSNRIQEISSSSQRINPILKRRKSQQAKKVVCIPAPGGANSRQGGGEVVPSDLWAWRKYGQKPIKGSPYPRGYYRCSSSKGCSARKQVERSRTDPTMLVITYTSEHNHPWPTQRNALAGSTRTFTATSPPPLSITTPPPSSSSSAPGAIYKHDHPRKLDCTTLSTDAVTAVEQCRLELEDDDQNNSSSFGVSSSGEAEPILQFVGDDHDHARNSQLHQQMPFSSLLMGGSSTPSITNDDQKQLFSSTTLFDWPLSNQPL